MNRLKNKNLISETEFSECFFEKLREKNHEIHLDKIENLTIQTKDINGDVISHFLDNAYSEYSNNPKEFDEIIERYSNGSKILYLEKEKIDINRVIPIIKDERFLSEIKNLNDEFEDNHLYEKYNSDLYIFYVEDLENSISYLKKEDLSVLNLNIDELKKLAIENLNSIIENIERNGDENIFILLAGGNYESSLILLDIWNHDNFPVDGEIIIGIPSRDLLFITGENQKDDIEELKISIKEINEVGDHIVSNKLFKLNNLNHFEVYE